MRTKDAKAVLEKMNLEELIELLNNYLDEEYCGLAKDCKIYKVDDKYFFYDDDVDQFFSFSTKDELVEIITEDIILSMIMDNADNE